MSESPERQALRRLVEAEERVRRSNKTINEIVSVWDDTDALIAAWRDAKAVLAQPDSIAVEREKVSMLEAELVTHKRLFDRLSCMQADSWQAEKIRAEAAEARVKELEQQALDAREAFKAAYFAVHLKCGRWWFGKLPRGMEVYEKLEAVAWDDYLLSKQEERETKRENNGQSERSYLASKTSED